MNNNNFRTLGVNLYSYVDVLIENYFCKTGKRPPILSELSKELFTLAYMDLDMVVSQENLETKSNLEQIFNLLRTTELDERELATLKSSTNGDWNNFKKEKTKKVEEKIENILKLVEKASKKYFELRNNFIRLEENNQKGIDEARKQHFTVGKVLFYGLYEDFEKKQPIYFVSGINSYISSLRQKMNESIQKNTSKVDVNFSDQMISQKQVIDEYEKMISEGKINVIDNKPLTFFAKMGFKPLKKQMSEREIIDKLSQTGYILDLIDAAIKCINTNESKKIFSQTLEELKTLRKKYSVISNKLEDDLKNSNYDEMKKAVDNQKEKEHQKEINRLKRQKCKLLYTKILKSEDDEEIKKWLEEIRMTELDENEKEEAKNEAAIEYKVEQENKEMERKVIREEQKQIHDYEAEVANAIRKRAIEELEMEHAFDSEYYESGLDVKDGMTASRKEDLIQRKVQELKRKDEITKQEQALQDLRNEGYIKREDATLANLKPYERDALYAQMRINARALEEQNNGRNR